MNDNNFIKTNVDLDENNKGTGFKKFILYFLTVVIMFGGAIFLFFLFLKQNNITINGVGKKDKVPEVTEEISYEKFCNKLSYNNYLSYFDLDKRNITNISTLNIGNYTVETFNIVYRGYVLKDLYTVIYDSDKKVYCETDNYKTSKLSSSDELDIIYKDVSSDELKSFLKLNAYSQFGILNSNRNANELDEFFQRCHFTSSEYSELLLDIDLYYDNYYSDNNDSNIFNKDSVHSILRSSYLDF